MAANADDERTNASQKLSNSVVLAVDTTARQTSDAVGPLRPGRYFIHALTLSARCWVRTVKFAKSTAAVVANRTTDLPAAGASAEWPEFPFDTTSGIKSIVINIKQGHNDRVEAICPSGTCTLVITRVGE